MRAILVGMLAWALVATTAVAAEDLNSANSILPGCKAVVGQSSATGSYAEGRCMGIVMATSFMAGNSDVAVSAFSGDGQLMWFKRHWRCADIPQGVTYGQAVQVVIRYIEARPYRMNEQFVSLALEALLDAWPCRD